MSVALITISQFSPYAQPLAANRRSKSSRPVAAIKDKGGWQG
jgi:hypothetical protein